MPDPRLGETLLAPRLVRLFGRKFEGLILGKEGIDPTSNNPLVLQEQIEGLTKRLDGDSLRRSVLLIIQL